MEKPSISANLKDLYKEFTFINKKSVFDDQASINFLRGEENPLDLIVVLTPNQGIWRECQLKFSLKLPANYPNSAPTVKCLNKIFHPNVSTSGAVCFSMFSSDFNSSYRLEQYINGLLWFINNPNPDSALNSACSIRNMEEYEKNVRITITGEKVKNYKYDRLIPGELVESVAVANIDMQFFPSWVREKYTFKSMIAAFTEPLPAFGWIHVAKKAEFDAEIIKTLGQRSSSIERRVKRLQAHTVQPNSVLKELVFMAENRLVLVVSNGHEQISFAKLAKALEVTPDKIVLLARSVVSTKLRTVSVAGIPAFGHEPSLFWVTVVNKRLTEECDLQKPIFTASGIPNLLLKTTMFYLLPLIPKDQLVIADVIEPMSTVNLPPNGSLPQASPTPQITLVNVTTTNTNIITQALSAITIS